ncbi:PD40 domain-containing protein [Leptolyngbya sp. FACHB-261]|uniref:TolB family protein n=1 Tax=Leptolyngbya sp. FACHB-261 TaxID=2692806 RepID=UPI001685B425|nr:PD40 domain-containing protein [Leptolyngbya sp. FACHB-261]MBD2103716.1 PD40 domain-containing protein [Leptolyngbya sp. FACHB-261]
MNSPTSLSRAFGLTASLLSLLSSIPLSLGVAAPTAQAQAARVEPGINVVQSYFAAAATGNYAMALTRMVPLLRTPSSTEALQSLRVERLVEVRPYQQERWTPDWQQYAVTLDLRTGEEVQALGANIRYLSLVRSAIGGRWLIGGVGPTPSTSPPGTDTQVAVVSRPRRVALQSSSFVWQSRAAVTYVGLDDRDPVLRQTPVIAAANPDQNTLAQKQLSEAEAALEQAGSLLKLQPGDLIRGMSLSKDGQRLVLALQRAGQTGGLWLADLAQGTLQPLVRPTDGRILITDPVWGPDEQSVLFTQHQPPGKDGTALPPQLQVLSLTTANAQPYVLTQGEAAAWSPDGRQLAFTRTGSRTDVATPTGALGAPGHIWVAKVQVSGALDSRRYQLETPTELTTGHQPAWSPDGRYLVVSDVRNDSRPFRSGVVRHRVQELWQVEVANGQRTQLTNHSFTESDWQQAFQRADNLGPGQVYALRNTPDDAWPQWSPDGRSIAFLREDLRQRCLSLWVLTTPSNPATTPAATSPTPVRPPQPSAPQTTPPARLRQPS